MSKLDQLRALREARTPEERRADLVAALEPKPDPKPARPVAISGAPKCPTCGRPFKEPWKQQGLSRRTYFRRKAKS